MLILFGKISLTANQDWKATWIHSLVGNVRMGMLYKNWRKRGKTVEMSATLSVHAVNMIS
jgi:hypothetical protein